MQNFEIDLRRKFNLCLSNSFFDNHDTARFGKEKLTAKTRLKRYLYKNYTSNYDLKKWAKRLEAFLSNFGSDASKCYNVLANEQSRNLYLDLICYKILGKEKVRIDTFDLESQRQQYKLETASDEQIQINFKSWVLDNYEVMVNDQPIKVFSRPSSVFNEFVAEQYSYVFDNVKICVEPGDYCIDGGACWGDSTLLFSAKAGRDGRVYGFEFIPGNIQILKKNLKQNNCENVTIIQHPLWSVDGISMWYKDNGPGSKVSFETIPDSDGTTTTFTIDKLVLENKLDKLDFIKMDIEGAEPFALEGAKDTIVKFKPKLAICIYHGMEDFTRIAQWIHNLGLGYRLYLKHVTIHWEETVLFAI